MTTSSKIRGVFKHIFKFCFSSYFYGTMFSKDFVFWSSFSELSSIPKSLSFCILALTEKSVKLSFSERKFFTDLSKTYKDVSTVSVSGIPVFLIF